MLRRSQLGFVPVILSALATNAQANDASIDSLHLESGRPAGGGVRVWGQVFAFDDRPSLAGGRVTLIAVNTGEERVARVKDDRYDFAGLRSGTYMLHGEAAGLRTAEQGPIDVADGDVVQRDLLLESSEQPRADAKNIGEPWGWAAGALAVFLAGILLTRWFKIAKPSHHQLRSRIEFLEGQMGVQAADPSVGGAIKSLISRLTDLKTAAAEQSKWSCLWQFLFWSQNQENAHWDKLHAVEADFAALHGTEDLVTAQLAMTEPTLRTLESECAKSLADEIKNARLSSGTTANLPLRRELLSQATATILQDRDERFKALTDWQNKASWLVLVAVLLMVVLGAVLGNLMLFVAGAAGGLLSRMMRAIRQPEFAIDYGASWSTLFLSPVFGALSAWLMIGVVQLLAHSQVGVLGGMFKLVRWEPPLLLSTLSVAFLLGFSERFFDSLVEAASGTKVKQASAAKSPASESAKESTASAGALQSITLEVAPQVPSGQKIQIKAWGAFTDGKKVDVTSAVDWLSSDATAATIELDKATSQMQVAGKEPGATQVTISASWLGRRGEAKIGVI